MGQRLALQAELETLLGSRNVYFNPPSTVQMNYPCIVYTRRNGDSIYADDQMYRHIKCYDVKVIDPNPDSVLPDEMLNHFKMIREDRHYETDYLHHTAFVIYY